MWAFGAVLYEMLTGKRVFAGTDLADTLAMVLTKEVDWSTLPADTPAPVRKVAERCLTRDPTQRIRDIGDVRLAMEGAFETTATPPSEPASVSPRLQLWQRPVPALLGALLLAIIAGVAVWSLSRSDVPPANVMRFVMPLAETAPLDFRGLFLDLAISADGSQVIYRGEAPGGGAQLYRRPIDQLDGVPLRGGEGGSSPSFPATASGSALWISPALAQSFVRCQSSAGRQ